MRPPLPVGGACTCEHSGLSGTCVRYLIHVNSCNMQVAPSSVHLYQHAVGVRWGTSALTARIGTETGTQHGHARARSARYAGRPKNPKPPPAPRPKAPNPSAHKPQRCSQPHATRTPKVPARR
eukprot:874845-Prymnesium_polylepis.1